MEKAKTNVQVTQELLALLNARRERLAGEDQSQADPSNDPQIKKVLDELSLSGDAVLASIDQLDPYFEADRHDPELFRQAVARLREEAQDMPESLQSVFNELAK